MAKKILIIEDEEPLAEEWALSLENEGYETKIAPTLKEILDILDKLDFDLILLDVMLPSFDVEEILDLESIQYGRTAGVWITKKIKEKKQNLPIIAVTVVTDIKILDELKNAGVRRILNKPFSNEDLVKMVNSILKENI